MFPLGTAIFLITITSATEAKLEQDDEAVIKNKTPCCIDRLSTVSCQRLQLFNPSLFLYNCVHNADFAFVQCCKTCFTQRTSNVIDLNYKKISENLLTNAASATCYDRRDKEWCEAMVHRKEFWKKPEYAKLGCGSMPFSFRVCRQSCGYCSTIKQAADVVYDYSVASDYRRCSSQQQAFAVEIKKRNATEITMTKKRSRFANNRKNEKLVLANVPPSSTTKVTTTKPSTTKLRQQKIKKAKKIRNKYEKKDKTTK